MRTTKKLIQLVIIALLLGACSQSSEAYKEDLALEDNYDYETVEREAIPVEESIVEKDKAYDLNGQTAMSEDENIVGNVNQTMVWSKEQESYVPKPKENKSIISSKGLSDPYKDKKFIKTADLVFSVEDVYQSTINIEEVLIANEGFLINSNLYAEVIRSQTFTKSPEMNVLVEEFETRNHITIRVPSENLHNTLLAIADEIVFLDSRSISADDVGLKLLAEELTQKRNAKSAQNLQNIANNGGKLYDKVYAEQLAFERETQKDISKLQELSIEDKVAYSTVTIAIYQNTELRSKESPNFDVYREQFELSYASELKDALANSFDLIKGVFTFILSVWPVLLILFIGAMFFKRRFLD